MSKRRDVDLAIRALVQAALPNARVRGFDKDAKKPVHLCAGGDVVGFPGTLEEIERALSPASFTYEQSNALEVAAPLGAADPDASVDRMLGEIGERIRADRTLGGLVSFVEARPAEVEDAAAEGAESIRWAGFKIVATFDSDDPLN